MKEKIIEQMLADIDNKYIAEAIEAGKHKSPSYRKPSVLLKKLAAAAIICIIVLGTCISVAATASDTFRSWLSKNFFGNKITQVGFPAENNTNNNDINNTTNNDNASCGTGLPAGENLHLSLKNNMSVYGTKESFVCQYHTNDTIIIDNVYSIQDDGLKKLDTKTFTGNYDGTGFTFEYAIINNEILGFNLDGSINEVFHYWDNGIVYASLDIEDNGTIKKGCIAMLNLNTGSVTQLTDDNTTGNMVMSPNGKIILINYRADGFWTAFNIGTRTEKKMKWINGYAHNDEILFKDDYSLLAYGDNGTNLIDLKTGKKLASYKEYGNCNPEWIYIQKKNKLEIKNIDGNTAITINNVQGTPHALGVKGSYILLGNLENANDPYYLCNVLEKTYIKINPLKGMGNTAGIYLTTNYDKVLISDGNEAYIIDTRPPK